MKVRCKIVWSIIAALYLFVSANPARAQFLKHAQCVADDVDTPTMPSCVIQSSNGSLFIPKRYWKHPSFNQYGLAAFTILSFGRVYINQTGRIVIRDVALIDNAPDEFHHGVVRIERDGKWGYADPSGQIIVPMQYSCALNSQDQNTDVGPLICFGCHPKQVGECKDSEDGQWFLVDAQGSFTPTTHPK